MMRTTNFHFTRAALALICWLAMAAGQAQDNAPAGDPARWYSADASEQAQLRTLRKEIGAAFQEAQAQCRRGPASERGACLQEARATYRSDMANVGQLRASAPQ